MSPTSAQARTIVSIVELVDTLDEGSAMAVLNFALNLLHRRNLDKGKTAEQGFVNGTLQKEHTAQRNSF